MDRSIPLELRTQLEADMRLIAPFLAKASEVVRNERVSNYPIIVASVLPIELGIDFNEHLSQKIAPINFYYKLTSLEEMYTKSIIFPEKIDDFRENYKSNLNKICIFLFGESDSYFVFMGI